MSHSFQERRPFLATECDDLPKAEKWRRQIIGEVSRKVAQIQNGGQIICDTRLLNSIYTIFQFFFTFHLDEPID